MWEWSKAGASPSDFEGGVEHAWSPLVVHKTRRSLRAVHFHPHGAPLMLTAEVSLFQFANPVLAELQVQPHSLSVDVGDCAAVSRAHPTDPCNLASKLALIVAPASSQSRVAVLS